MRGAPGGEIRLYEINLDFMKMTEIVALSLTRYCSEMRLMFAYKYNVLLLLRCRQVLWSSAIQLDAASSGAGALRAMYNAHTTQAWI